MKLPDDVRKTVSETYSKAVGGSKSKGSTCCCCAGPVPKGVASNLAGYTREALAALPEDAVVNSFGCGNPVALAQIREGETVLDLGSGAGIDLLLAGKLAGPTGRVIGVDMTPAMIQRANANIAEAGLTNVEVRQGIIENMPVETASVDLILSNCVINLSPEKPKVFAEIARVLRPGGRFSISDIVAKEMPEWVQKLGLLYSACVAGAIPETDYLHGLRQAGLVDVRVEDRLVYESSQLKALMQSELLDGGSCCGGPSIPDDVVDAVTAALDGKVASIRVTGLKPSEVA